MKKNKIFIFLLFSLFYFCIGFYYREFFETNNIFFGADVSRIIDDLTIFDGNHYRTKVHPLFVILFNPFGVFINYFIKNKILTSIFMTSLCASGVIFILFKYIKELAIELRIIFVMFYSFSMTTLIFSSIPETFIFGTFTLILNHYLFEKIIEKIEKNEYDNELKKIIILNFLSIILCFGITITNIIPSIILLIGILIKIDLEKTLKLFNIKKSFSKIKTFLGVLFIVMSISTTGTIGQKIIYRSSGLFFTSSIQEELNYIKFGEKNAVDKIKEFLLTNETLKTKIEIIRGKKINFEEVDKTTKNNNFFEQTENVIKNLFIYSLISPLPKEDDINKLNYNIESYNSYNFIEKISVGIWFSFIIYCIFYSISKKIYINYFIVLCILFNTCLHLLYGANESFLYSPHIFFLYILLESNCVKMLKKNNFFYKGFIFLGIGILIITISNNIQMILKIKEIL